MKFYVLCPNNQPKSPNTLFFKHKENAIKALDEKKKEIMRRGVSVTKDTDEEFSFYFGWEETQITWRIRELITDD